MKKEEHGGHRCDWLQKMSRRNNGVGIELETNKRQKYEDTKKMMINTSSQELSCSAVSVLKARVRYERVLRVLAKLLKLLGMAVVMPVRSMLVVNLAQWRCIAID